MLSCLESGGDGGVIEGAAVRAGAEVAPVLGHRGGQRGQFGDLVPGRLGVVGPGAAGQRRSNSAGSDGG